MKNRRRTSPFRGSRRSAAAGVVVFLTTIVAGCADTRGPELVVNSHIDYN